MIKSLVRGATAGAAGTTVLNAATYADMAWRARGSSDVPDQVVDALAKRVGHPVPGSGEDRENRLTGLGALSGMAVGSGVGAAMAVTRRIGIRLPLWLGGVVTGALAMALTDAPMGALGVSDPRTWSRTDWVSDALPHLAYGLATYATVIALEGSRDA
ncbi:hypothetical protein GXW83_14630 [Streptacidiphilus sp. PB12-B1b]|uniref:hypothetical protein n=1 Tax=Streptacidiphilus sp. PB12-B1b TaxID=2705012 RepID=UPI0015F98D99|nr:hypothetical protein [Streptacidiphilus sp. PB12-B1b]QMU76789.1 hypothetical protein GXW83_14630 [Streptacidiphilus sp. PB12-B1b]